MRRRPREFGDREGRLGDLPVEALYPQRHDLTPGRGIDLKARMLRRGNFSPAIQYTTGDGKSSALPMNPKRNYLIVYNADGANTLWVNVTVSAAVNACIPIPANGNWEPWIAPVNAIFLIGAVNGQLAILMEGTQS